MTTSTIGLLAGLLLGIAAATGGFFGFLLAPVLGVGGCPGLPAFMGYAGARRGGLGLVRPSAGPGWPSGSTTTAVLTQRRKISEVLFLGGD